MSKLKRNIKVDIALLTDMSKNLLASDIVNAVTEYGQNDLIMLYVLDSIMKTQRHDVVRIVSEKIVEIFSTIFEKSDSDTQAKLKDLMMTWKGLLPAHILREIECELQLEKPPRRYGQKVPKKVF